MSVGPAGLVLLSGGREAPALIVILSEGREAPAVEGSRWLQRLAATEGLPRPGGARSRPGAPTGEGARAPSARARACGSRPAEKRQSRADGQICPSARPLMVRPPARSPYETSTNRQAGGLKPRRGRRVLRSCARAPTCGDWCRFRAAGRGSGAHSTCEQPRMHEPQASAAAAARGPRAAGGAAREAPAAGRMNVFSAKRGKIFNLCGTPQNMTPRHIISDLRFLRNACVGCAANGPRRHRKRQEFQLVAPQVEILASLRENGRGGPLGRRVAARGGGRPGVGGAPSGLRRLRGNVLKIGQSVFSGSRKGAVVLNIGQSVSPGGAISAPRRRRLGPSRAARSATKMISPV